LQARIAATAAAAAVAATADAAAVYSQFADEKLIIN